MEMAGTDSTATTEDNRPGDNIVIIGAGPAGLTAAYCLGRRGRRATVLEADSVVGGISRTVQRDGWRFDIGGHRFFSQGAGGGGLVVESPPAQGLPLRAPPRRLSSP